MADMRKIQCLKKLCGISLTDSSEDDRLSFAIDYAENSVKNFCRIDAVPKELEGVVFLIAKDLYNNDGGDFGGLKALKEGDVRFEFSPRASDLNSILKDYINQLEIFRKPGW